MRPRICSELFEFMSACEGLFVYNVIVCKVFDFEIFRMCEIAKSLSHATIHANVYAQYSTAHTRGLVLFDVYLPMDTITETKSNWYLSVCRQNISISRSMIVHVRIHCKSFITEIF